MNSEKSYALRSQLSWSTYILALHVADESPEKGYELSISSEKLYALRRELERSDYRHVLPVEQEHTTQINRERQLLAEHFKPAADEARGEIMGGWYE